MGGSAELQPGDTLGAYRLETVIGEGAVGLVFRARRHADDRQVALKVLKRELASDYVFQHRFRQEARAAAEVREPHLVAIVDADTVDGRAYLAVDYIGGGSLAERIASAGTLPIADVVRVASDVAAGLDALHAAEIAHRDVKPSNILFDTDGTAMLTDFGLAKGRTYTVLTRPGQVLGTLNYLAPELIRGDPATARSDVYGLGCVIFECVSGRAPFADKGVFQVGLAHLMDEPPNPCAERPELQDGFCTAILTALEKEPERRPQSAGAYARALAAASVEEASV